MDTLRTLLVERIAPLKDLRQRTVDLYCDTLDRWAEYLGHDPLLDDLDDLGVAKFLRWRADNHRRRRGNAPLSKGSVAKDSAQIRSIWNWCAKKRMKKTDGDLIEFPDYKRPIVPRPRPQAFTADELRRLIETARHRKGSIKGIPAAWVWSTMIQAMFETGARIGEILAIRWSEVDLERCQLTFLAETRKGRIETITRAISPQLAQRMGCSKQAPAELVWPWMDDRNGKALYNSLRVLCRCAEVPYKSFHSIRKATASYLKAAGVSAKAQLGHASEEMAERHYYDARIVGTQSALEHLPDIG
jgi:integrase